MTYEAIVGIRITNNLVNSLYANGVGSSQVEDPPRQSLQAAIFLSKKRYSTPTVERLLLPLS